MQLRGNLVCTQRPEGVTRFPAVVSHYTQADGSIFTVRITWYEPHLKSKEILSVAICKRIGPADHH